MPYVTEPGPCFIKILTCHVPRVYFFLVDLLPDLLSVQKDDYHCLENTQ